MYLQNFKPYLQATLMVMQFGQFLDHDITLTAESEAEGCCSEEAPAPGCFPILFADSDPTFVNRVWKYIIGNCKIVQSLSGLQLFSNDDLMT